MKKFLVILSALCFVLSTTSSVYADTLYDLYSDHGSPATSNTGITQSTHIKHHKKKSKNTSNNKQVTTSTNSQSSGAQSVYKAVNNNQATIIEKGSQNYSANGYAASRKLTNPINLDNPYSNLNSHIKGMTSNSNNSITSEDVVFRKDIWGNINGYNSEGKKIGTYKINK